jgi:hypothetical protein
MRFSQVGSSLACKYWTRLEVTDIEKESWVGSSVACNCRSPWTSVELTDRGKPQIFITRELLLNGKAQYG